MNKMCEKVELKTWWDLQLVGVNKVKKKTKKKKQGSYKWRLYDWSFGKVRVSVFTRIIVFPSVYSTNHPIFKRTLNKHPFLSCAHSLLREHFDVGHVSYFYIFTLSQITRLKHTSKILHNCVDPLTSATDIQYAPNKSTADDLKWLLSSSHLVPNFKCKSFYKTDTQ